MQVCVFFTFNTKLVSKMLISTVYVGKYHLLNAKRLFADWFCPTTLSPAISRRATHSPPTRPMCWHDLGISKIQYKNSFANFGKTRQSL